MNKKYIPYLIYGWLFVLFYIVIGDLQNAGNIVWTGLYILKLLGLSLVLGGLLGVLLRFLLGRFLFDKKTGTSDNAKTLSPRFITLGSGLVLTVCQLPAWLAYCPGICAYDFYVQLEQIVNGAYNTHHPLVHTLLLRFFVFLGKAVGSATVGIALYSLLQVILLSLAIGYSLSVCYRVIAKTSFRKYSLHITAGLLILVALNPFQYYMALSVTKDVPFSMCVLVMISSFVLCVMQTESSRKTQLLCFASAFGMMLFRNNALYALLLIALILLILIKRYRDLFIGFAVSIVAAVFVLNLVSGITSAEQGDKREMLSVPIQQLARVMVYHADELSPEQINVIDDFLLDQSYQLYNPYISDPVKRNTNTSVLLRRTSEFVRTYLDLFLTYPGDYINATLSTNAGFLSPADTSHASINLYEDVRGLGYAQTRWEEASIVPNGIHKASLFPALYAFMEDWASDNAYLQIPVFGFLLRPGLVIWLLLLAALILLEKRSFRLLLPVVALIGYFATMLLGPTVQLRYIYPIALCLPLLFSITLLPKESK